MGDKTGIAWTEATWNPVTGCDKVTPGCDHCYAASIAHRFDGTPAYPNGFAVTLRPERLDQPLRWKRPRMVFVNSMSDLFHKDIPDEYIAEVFAVMAIARRHTFQVLTKRHARMRSLLSSESFRAEVSALRSRVWNDHYRGTYDVPDMDTWPLPNVWMGVSAEDQQRALLRIPALLKTPAAVRFVSAEPLLGPIDLTEGSLPGRPWNGWLSDADEDEGITDGRVCTGHGVDYPCRQGCAHLDWIIVGGESGPGARPMASEWARSLRDQCEAAAVPFFFKQAGTVLAREWGCSHRKGEDPAEWPEPFPQEFPR